MEFGDNFFGASCTEVPLQLNLPTAQVTFLRDTARHAKVNRIIAPEPAPCATMPAPSGDGNNLHKYFSSQTSTATMVKKESEDSAAPAAKMEPKEPKDSKMSAFERKRLENIAANQAIMKDLSTTAKKIIPKTAAPKPPRSKTPRKREPPVKKEATRPTRTSSRIAGLEADGEGAKRKFEEEFQFAQDEAKAKKMRVAGDLNLSDIAVEGKKWTNDLTSIMRGAQPYERTFDESDIKTTTDQELKSLREKMSGLELYKTWEPNGEKSLLFIRIAQLLTVI